MLRRELATFRVVNIQTEWTKPDIPTIAAEMMGSVGVKQAAIASEETNDSRGNKLKMTTWKSETVC
jgi:hypothetical protein